MSSKKGGPGFYRHVGVDKNGKDVWELQVSTGKRGKNGRYIKKTKRVHGSERHARDTLSVFFAEIHGERAFTSKMTIGDLADRYMEQVAHMVETGSRKRTAIKTTHAPIEKWIRPYLGYIKITRLSADDIQDMVDIMSGELSSHTVRNYIGVLSQMLEHARRDLKLPIDDIIAMVRMPHYQRPEPEYYTEAETMQIVDALNDMDDRDMYKSCFLICLFSGIRVGELSGINRDDYDSDRCVITIRRGRQMLPGIGIIEDTPKTSAGVREIKIPQSVCHVIDEFLLWQDEQIRTMDGFVDSGALIMSGANAIYQHRTPGDAVSPLAVSRAWHRFCDDRDIPYHSLHKLRHTHASIIHELDVSDSAIQQHMGHADLSITHSVYTHLFREQEQDIADGLEKRFFGAGDIDIPSECSECKFAGIESGLLVCRLRRDDNACGAGRPEWCIFEGASDLLCGILRDWRG